jgi:hypothetical protein
VGAEALGIIDAQTSAIQSAILPKLERLTLEYADLDTRVTTAHGARISLGNRLTALEQRVEALLVADRCNVARLDQLEEKFSAKLRRYVMGT